MCGPEPDGISQLENLLLQGTEGEAGCLGLQGNCNAQGTSQGQQQQAWGSGDSSLSLGPGAGEGFSSVAAG